MLNKTKPQPNMYHEYSAYSCYRAKSGQKDAKESKNKAQGVNDPEINMNAETVKNVKEKEITSDSMVSTF